MDKEEKLKKAIKIKINKISQEIIKAEQLGDKLRVEDLERTKSLIERQIFLNENQVIQKEEVDLIKSQTYIVAAENENLKKELLTILSSGGNDNKIIMTLDDTKNYYLQFVAAKESNRIHCECVHNNYLNKAFQLTPVQEKTLLQYGWSDPKTVEGNFHYDYHQQGLESLEVLLKMIHETANNIYGTTINANTLLEVMLE